MGTKGKDVSVSAYAAVHLENRLSHWGRWRIRVITETLGYPDRSSISRIKDDGGLVSASTYKPNIPLDEDAEEMDQLVNELEAYENDLGKAIKIKYSSLHVVTYELDVRKMKFSTYHNNVRLGKMWLLGRITR